VWHILLRLLERHCKDRHYGSPWSEQAGNPAEDA
jgi:hypothetical protein